MDIDTQWNVCNGKNVIFVSFLSNAMAKK